MFDVRCRSKLPLDYLEITSVWVRGALGPMTVWTTPDSFNGKHENGAAWTCIFSQNVNPSPLELVELKLDRPLRLENGQSAGLYVHSATPGDEGLGMRCRATALTALSSAARTGGSAVPSAPPAPSAPPRMRQSTTTSERR